jgi:mRNA-degrading endonuclease RelE of RelBE toxin-antitoxin system/DNA-binding XRE family transcriptional regulator
VYTVVTTRSFAKALSRPPVNWQRRIVEKIKDPYARHNNVTRLQGRDGYRLRVGDWRVIYELHDDRLEIVGLRNGSEGRDLLMRVETITRKGREFALVPVQKLEELIKDAEMLADVKAYDAAKARIEGGEDELIPLEITERRLKGESALRIWREYRKLTQERLAKKSKVSRALIAAIETKRKAGSVSTWKRLGAALEVSWEQLA